MCSKCVDRESTELLQAERLETASECLIGASPKGDWGNWGPKNQKTARASQLVTWTVAGASC